MHVNLTKRQEAFCLAYVETSCATEAYRKAGYSLNGSEQQIWSEASQMLKNQKVSNRIWELRTELNERGILRLEEHLANLQHLRNQAANAGKWQAAIVAEIAMGKVSGLYDSAPQVTVNADVSLASDAKVYESMTTEELRLIEKAQGVFRGALERISE